MGVQRIGHAAIFPEQPRRRRQVQRQFACCREPVARVADRRRQQIGERHRAPTSVELLPRIDEARDRYRAAAVSRYAVGIARQSCRRGRLAAGADRRHVPLALWIREDVRVAAQVVAMRLYHRKHRRHRERRIKCVAATPQHIDARLRHERVLGRHHAVRCEHRAAEGGDVGGVRHVVLLAIAARACCHPERREGSCAIWLIRSLRITRVRPAGATHSRGRLCHSLWARYASPVQQPRAVLHRRPLLGSRCCTGRVAGSGEILRFAQDDNGRGSNRYSRCVAEWHSRPRL